MKKKKKNINRNRLKSTLQTRHRDKTEVACLATQVTAENHSETCLLTVYYVCMREFNGGTRTEQQQLQLPSRVAFVSTQLLIDFGVDSFRLLGLFAQAAGHHRL